MEAVEKVDFCKIYRRFYYRVYKVAYRILKDECLAEDVTQETFIKALAHIGTRKDPDKTGAWLASISSRTAVDFLRKQKRARHVSFEIECSSFQARENVEREVEQWSMEQEIMQELSLLTYSLRKVFLLKYREQWKEAEIALALNIPVGTVKTRLYRARHQMKAKLEKKKDQAGDGMVLPA
ncbi:RNA polymerase sigma factor [Sediminibacillus massiliensis]|uniref:RNA polymerase sigma factor n=1 Tax=Sediminibacillus massiliensis TaxID=1926277 RepID=UPI0009884708|nr:RNA polymerase sigma factor [Sediminibacillus massiliensis]